MIILEDPSASLGMTNKKVPEAEACAVRKHASETIKGKFHGGVLEVTAENLGSPMQAPVALLGRTP